MASKSFANIDNARYELKIVGRKVAPKAASMTELQFHLVEAAMPLISMKYTMKI